ncbi:3-oxoacyl-[acyl-carrier-protein] reductase FabG-like [Gigantopelta aegis]|uniref:3-oxoacyl-[acyl-carrier-protein] reductase FabG-like n=1 Tax=Gigantopelta aegis TaxID=1735272 RepID=UPI001B88BB32|nr:3-oxoacyl-[acyl-carrier-protein] reductase FabG-like [Gigantopelta aegis]
MATGQTSLGRLNGKIALITGASSGIGAGTAILFAKLGARLAITGRNVDNLRKTALECQSHGQEKPLEVVTHTYVPVNNAGIVQFGTIEMASLQQYDNIMDTNTRTMYHVTMLCVPHLIETKGNIVNVSSVNGIRSIENMLDYCMSKSAVDQMTRCTALELASKQVRVNSVNPGFVVTDIHRRAGINDDQYQQYLEHVRNLYPLGRPGEVEDVAKVIAFLASDEASFITGASVPIDGGRHVMCPR